MIRVKEWAMIHTYYQQGMPKSRIVQVIGVDRKTDDRVLAGDSSQEPVRAGKPSILDPYKPYVNPPSTKVEGIHP